MRRTRCGACGCGDLEVFLDLGRSPVADAYTAMPYVVSSTYPLQLAVCGACQLVQLTEVLDGKTLFGTGYSFYSSASSPLSRYHEAYATQVLYRHAEEAKRLTVEVGCNDGDFLRHLAAAGCTVVGVDPASGPAARARERGLDVVEEPFGLDVARRIRGEYGPAGLVVANHVLAHVESVADVLDGIEHVLAPDGVAYVEVQYLPDLLVNNAFDLVYHEHRNFFSLTSLADALAARRLWVAEARFTDRQGGSLRVVVTRNPNWPYSVDDVLRSEEWLRGPGAYAGFQGRVERVRARLLDLLDDYPRPVAGVGAPAKATTLLNFCKIGTRDVAVITDTTPEKRGRYVPGTGIPVVAPDAVDLNDYPAALLLAWNYASEIVRRTRYDGPWVVPLPAPVVL